MGSLVRIMACATLVLTGAASTDNATVDFSVAEAATGKPVPCRIHLRGPDGKPVRPEALPFWRDHFVCSGSVSLALKPGKYAYEIERGPEYAMTSGDFTVASAGPVQVRANLKRLVELPRDGWWSGELHVHRPIEDMKLLMQAEDLHVAPVITWWQNRKGNRTTWVSGKRLPTDPLVHFDGDRYYQVMGGEDERQGGALLFFNLPRPLVLGAVGPEYPSPLKFVADAQADGAWIDIEKPFWWDVPVWLACTWIDSIGVANNHMCRSSMSETEAWGKPRDTKRLPPPTGNGYWTQEIYYHLLNSGLRVPPSAGSASGVLPNPVGYNRVYVHVDGEFTYKQWWENLRRGHVFVTNGPLLRVRANDRLPGHVFTAPAGKEVDVDIKVELTTRDPIRAVEIIQDGRVERAVPYADVIRTGSLGKLRMAKSGWFLVRAIAENTNTFRFASTGPFYVEVGETKRPVHKRSAQFFLDWVEERGRNVLVDDAAERRAVLKYHEQARRYWQDKVAHADRFE